ncbi:hypothetical protein [Vibrio anguillarum]|uniref:hypothetical protein n=1 Tax=Vibrio anguillarum TaxID=55601 RepID=UPI0030EC94FD
MLAYIKKFFCRTDTEDMPELALPSTNGLETIKVDKLPNNLYKKFQSRGLTQANHCFMNCSALVNNELLADKYVLCVIKERNGKKHTHAIIKIEDQYYDPTLNHRLDDVENYWFHSCMDRFEIRDFLKQWYGDIFAKSKEAEVYPPALRKDGRVVCEAIELERT